MLIKEEAYKTNFIDENDVFVGYDTSQQCCESWSWFIAKDKNEEDSSGFKVIPENDLPEALQGYVFDTKYFEEKGSSTDEDNSIVQFRLVKKGEKNLYLSLTNSHNGYYSHGFIAKVGGEVWQEGCI